jgi:non-haem Fe2+, alpha-ketoglutarate-dependent halogenase
MVEVDEARGVDVVLHPGEMSLHHVRMFHGSPPNRFADRRIGYAIRYIPTRIKQVAGARDSATLVRGVDPTISRSRSRPRATSIRPRWPGTRRS